MSLRPIVRDRVEFEQPRQGVPTMEWISIADLVIDDSYQRDLSRANWAAIRKIAAAFRWTRFTPLVVAPLPGGKYAVIDGQHRTHAAALCGIDRVPAMIAPMDIKEQAASFVWVNGQVVKITGFHIFRAALAANEPWANDCARAVRDAGCRLMTSNASTANKRPGEIYAIALVRAYVETGLADHLTTCLAAMRKAEGHDMSYYFTNSILRPWVAAVAESTRFARSDLVEFLAQNDVLEMQNDARSKIKSAHGAGQSSFKLLKSDLVERLREFTGGPQHGK